MSPVQRNINVVHKRDMQCVIGSPFFDALLTLCIATASA